ncbi:hypothetical protein [Burkholderia multivorans]|uniref:hypothetical protein n=1 Tax=Burkholderia multivorans TaxID=87883 RepID=UPI00057F9C4D|nr:hypothetical protein [Burkholderia multivorans]KHS09420.1 hypothetical protein BMD20_29550 [Burkholderia multivorans]KHS10383.1 hypothetical protein BMD22_28275 [Burkholderia multivorans]MDR9230040.1 hypothetical protein [Burkholderia multivorans]HDR9474405.1 hypothetical protein [Burkholderia multivorans]HDR9480247.1 hypothetical protein [Burkholderia multivorans]
MNETLQQLANGPAGNEQFTRARELCGDSKELHAELDALIQTTPTRGQVLDFLETLNKRKQQQAVDAEILRICQAVGIESPSPQDRLIAMQIGMLREQNVLLQRIAGRVGEIAKTKPLTFTDALGAVAFGNILTR